MDVLLVPHTPSQTTMAVWLAAIGPGIAAQLTRGLSLVLQPGGRSIPVPADGWRPLAYPAGGRDVFLQTVTIDALEPGTRYALRVAHADRGRTARFSTLPHALPAEGSRPFTLLLASCFSHANDQEGRLGRLVRLLPDEHRPDVKILCGDQVYLDMPVLRIRRANEASLASQFVATYLRTWTDEGPAGEGYLRLLETGGSFLTADDHEFWNNYPNWTTLTPATWSGRGRRAWAKAARALYDDFQTVAREGAGRPQRFAVGRLSFFVADCRLHREPGDERFMKDDDLDALEAWVDGLEGPGALVVGQPLLEAPAQRVKAKVADRTLANYAQYTRLVRALARSRHSVLVLTGDVHYGRVARLSLGGIANRRALIEVIASPSSLVSRLVGGKAHDPPGRFPPMPVPGLPPVATRTIYKTAEEHVATLQLTERNDKVRIRAHYWFPKRVAAQVIARDTLEALDL